MASVKLRNIGDRELEVPAIGATVEPDCVVEFAGRVVDDSAELATHLGLPDGTPANWPDDVIHAWVERVGQILAFPAVAWRLESAPKRASRKSEES